jgi:hypothetical protein
MSDISFPVKLFRRSVKSLHFLKVALDVAHEGFWLGVLNRKALQEIVGSQYRSIDDIYRTQDWNLKGLFDWEQKCIETFFSDCSSILLGGAGGGRELVALIRQGFRVDGFDCAPQFVSHGQALLESLAQEKSQSEGQVYQGRLFDALPDTVPDSLGHYDGCILGWAAYSHVQGRENRINLLKQFRSHMDKGAPLLISFKTRSDSRQLSGPTALHA